MTTGIDRTGVGIRCSRETAARFMEIADELSRRLDALRFDPPVAHVYHPLMYARDSYADYVRLYGGPPKEIVLLGMNPGPFGMVQTGIPFGEIATVRDWLKITKPVPRPSSEHPRRPILGLECPRSEVSGRRLWGWARTRFEVPERFFARFFILNYCPLAFIEASGRNRTPDQLRRVERQALFDACDAALRRHVDLLQPRHVVGIGRFAEGRARHALVGMPVTISAAPHPSPANPSANRGWEAIFTKALGEAGIAI